MCQFSFYYDLSPSHNLFLLVLHLNLSYGREKGTQTDARISLKDVFFCPSFTYSVCQYWFETKSSNFVLSRSISSYQCCFIVENVYFSINFLSTLTQGGDLIKKVVPPKMQLFALLFYWLSLIFENIQENQKVSDYF